MRAGHALQQSLPFAVRTVLYLHLIATHSKLLLEPMSKSAKGEQVAHSGVLPVVGKTATLALRDECCEMRIRDECYEMSVMIVAK